jgi:glycerol-3-phosphate dehydrogenase (NAD(P)+)
MEKTNIIILGGGSIGTAIGNSLAERVDLYVRILSIEEEVVKSISVEHINHKYFPNLRLNEKLEATSDEDCLKVAQIILIAIPSVAVIHYLKRLEPLIPSNAVLVNLAKGFGNNQMLISDCIKEILPNPIAALKGPSFAREILTNTPTSFTLASVDELVIKHVSVIFEKTNLYVDHSTDIQGVEILSILKNIYAIIIGIVDAHFNSPNLRFMIFTKAFNEMRQILLHFGGKEETMFNYCGIGDFGLTALNDLSRNRTLGLLIGKGFFTEDISGKVVLEGRIAMNVFLQKLKDDRVEPRQFQLMSELESIFEGRNDVSGFVNKIINY